MAMYTVDSAHLAESSARVAATGEVIRAEVTAMLLDLEALRDSWGGVAASAFTECADRWRMTQAHVEESLDMIGQQLASASEVYTQAEEASFGLFAGA